MTTKTTENMPELCLFKFCCKKCDYNTNKKSSMDNHKLSSKHARTTEIMPKLCLYTCANYQEPFKDHCSLEGEREQEPL